MYRLSDGSAHSRVKNVPLCLAILLCYCTPTALSALIAPGFNVTDREDGFSITIYNTEIIRHTSSSPFLFVGRGNVTFVLRGGDFDISHEVLERRGLPGYNVRVENRDVLLTLFDDEVKVSMTLHTDEFNTIVIRFPNFPPNFNSLWFRLKSDKDEYVFGGGEQFHHLNLKGRKFPIWTSEKRVGIRNADGTDGAASSDSHQTTYYPLPTFVTSRKFYCHVVSHVYTVLDFTAANHHEVFVNGIPDEIDINADFRMEGLIRKLTFQTWRPPLLPEWIHNGLILGVQGGTDKMVNHLEKARKNGLSISGLWIQDWAGQIKTSFGTRVFWNWQWDKRHYPGLDTTIKQLNSEGVRTLGYINPYLTKEGPLFAEAESKGYFVKNPSGQTYLIDFGEYLGGTIDLSNPDAYQWYKEIIKKELIEFGFGGWMADFGEYIPIDAVFFNNETGLTAHNKYPLWWGMVNRQAAQEADQASPQAPFPQTMKTHDTLFFMRSGAVASNHYSPLFWAGDQLVDFGMDGGLPSALTAALSLAMSGIGYTHFDIGGYTTTANATRSEELFFRSAELAVFTPLMRTHEGNRPAENFQVYSSDKALRSLAVLVDMYKALAAYSKAVFRNCSRGGIPVHRPLFLHYDADPTSYEIGTQYLYGNDLLVAPVLKPGVQEWKLYLPPDNWLYLYDETKRYVGPIWATVPAPLGRPPVFYREASPWKSTFRAVKAIALGEKVGEGEASFCTAASGSENDCKS